MQRLPKFKLAGLAAVAAAGFMVAVSAGVVSAQQYPAPAGPVVSPAPPPPGLAPPAVPVYPSPGAGAPVLVAPPAPPPAAPGFASGFQVIAYPYLWFAGLNMAIETPLARAPQVDISAGAGEILSNISTMPFMGAAELRYGPFGVLTDGLHVPVVVPITTRNLFFSGGSTAVVLNVAAGDALYRVLDQPWQTVDAGLGFRHWGASTVTTLFARPLLQALSLVQTQQTMTSGGWTDPLIAARYHRDLGNGFGLTAYGDVGGFGIAAHSDWEIIGTLEYAWSPALTFDVGYRSLNVSYSLSRRPIGFDAHLKGPLLGLTLRF
jgi:hypothetical protein